MPIGAFNSTLHPLTSALSHVLHIVAMCTWD